MSAKPGTQAKPLGNLSSVLTSYEQKTNGAYSGDSDNKESSSIEDQIFHTTSLPLDLVSGRDRGFTFGSEFDLGFENLDGNLVLESDSIAGHLGPVVSQKSKEGNSASVSISVSSGNSSIRHETKRSNDSTHLTLNSESKSQENLASTNDRSYPSPGSSQSSTSGMLSGYFGTSATTSSMKIPSGDAMNKTHQDKKTQSTVVAHTPPSLIGTSYESKHFGKRMRAGSISGRVRAMSDLQVKGIIDRQQKNILKDLIITGDDTLQSALDLYEKGDSSQLEDMIKSGALQNKDSKDIDLLAALDLDFLNMNESDVQAKEIDHMGALESNNLISQSFPIKTEEQYNRSTSSQVSRNIPIQNMKTGGFDRENSNEYQDDGIGDLIFNGEFSDTEEYLSLPTGRTDGTNSQSSNGSTNTAPQRSRSTSAVDMMRFRANSLAFGGLLEEPSSENIYGKWMDRSPILESDDKSKNQRGMNGKKKTSRSQIIHHTVEQNGKSYYGTSNKNIDDGHNRTDNAKSQQALLKKLEREGKKAEKERKKQERKEKKEQEMKLKKAKEAKEKQQKKEMKAALAKLRAEDKRKKKQDTSALTTPTNTQQSNSDFSKESMMSYQENAEEPKVIESGTGRPRSLSDPNLSIGVDKDGLMQVDRPDGWVGAYSPDSRKLRIERFLEKRNHRVWTKKVKYDVRKNFADSRLRVKGRFVKKEDELLMRDLMSLT